MKILRNLFIRKGNEGSAAVLKNSTLQIKYFCPMKCEGEKTYNTPGNCPECNMKLVSVDSVSTDHNHGHNGRSHHCCG